MFNLQGEPLSWRSWEIEVFSWFLQQKPFGTDLTDSVMAMSVGQACKIQEWLPRAVLPAVGICQSGATNPSAYLTSHDYSEDPRDKQAEISSLMGRTGYPFGCWKACRLGLKRLLGTLARRPEGRKNGGAILFRPWPLQTHHLVVLWHRLPLCLQFHCQGRPLCVPNKSAQQTDRWTDIRRLLHRCSGCRS